MIISLMLWCAGEQEEGVADEAEGAGHRAHLPDVQVDSTHQGQLGLLLITGQGCGSTSL
jgi:hypothetical protein